MTIHHPWFILIALVALLLFSIFIVSQMFVFDVRTIEQWGPISPPPIEQWSPSPR